MWVLLLALAQQPPGDPDRYLLIDRDTETVQAWEAIVAVAPVFPEGLVTGPDGETVRVDVNVGRDGLLTEAAVSSESKLARIAALKALGRWRVRPAHAAVGSRKSGVVFVFRTMPPGTPVEELATVFRGGNEVEVRRVGPE